MKRSILWAILLLLAVSGLAAAFIRFELAGPGVSRLSQALGGESPGYLFNAVVTVHGLAGTLLPPLVAALAGLVAGTRSGRMVAALALAMAALLAVQAVGVLTGARPVILSAELAAPSSVWTWLGHEAVSAPVGLALGLASLAALLDMGGAHRRALGPLVMLAVASALALCLRNVWLTGMPASPAPLAVPALGLFLLGLFAWGNPAAPWTVAGTALTIFGLTRFGWSTATVGFDDTYVVVANPHMTLWTFLPFALLGTLAAWIRPNPSPRLAALFSAVMAVGLVAAFLPMLVLGRAGMPRRYIDYPDAFAFWNLVSSLGALAALAGFLGALGLIVLRRARD